MKIVNGRKIGDLMGKFTCYDPRAETPSVIDYAISDPELLDEISLFRIKNFTTFSDHCPMEIKISSNFTLQKSDPIKINLSKPPDEIYMGPTH